MSAGKPRRYSDPAQIELLILDVDGVLTDGRITYIGTELESKSFHVRDGMGLRVWRELGYKTAIVTGRGGEAVEKRAAELRVDKLVQRASPKSVAVESILSELDIAPERTACIGDDWNDLSVMARVGLPIAVADADERVKHAAGYITSRRGGHGAVREVVELLLTARGELERGIGLVN